jgi:hypothetical protein
VTLLTYTADAPSFAVSPERESRHRRLCLFYVYREWTIYLRPGPRIQAVARPHQKNTRGQTCGRASRM